MKLPKPNYDVVDPGGKHKYYIKTASAQSTDALDSVTKVLDVMAKPALIMWSAKEAAKYFKAEILRLGAVALTPDKLDAIEKAAYMAHKNISKDAADLGTAVHDICEAIVLGSEPENIPQEIAEPIKAFKTYRLQSKVEIVATELAVGSLQWLYGGRLDNIGYDNSRGGWGIGDYKTSSGFYGNEYAYQVGGGYALAVEEMFGIQIRWADIIRFGKKPPYDSEVRSLDFEQIQEAKAGFLHALQLHRKNQLPLLKTVTFQHCPTTKEEKSLVGAAQPKANKGEFGF